MHLEGDDFLKAYGEMTPGGCEQSVETLPDRQKEYVVAMQEAERRRVQLQSGNVDAPDFTFKTRRRERCLAFRFPGKWVVIDFWGAGVRGASRGFPALKRRLMQNISRNWR